MRALAGDRRKAALAVRRLTKPLSAQGFWKSAVTWKGEHCLGITPIGGDNFNVQTNLAKSPLMGKIDVEHLKPAHWPEDSTAEAPSLLRQRLEKKQAQFQRWIARASKDLESTGAFLIMAQTSGQEADEELATLKSYTPVSFFKAEHLPAGHGSFTSTYVLGSKALGWRFGPAQLPYPCMGAFWHQLSGSVLLLCIPMRAVLEQKANPRDLGELLEGLAASDCSSFLNDNCVFMHLKKGESCWTHWPVSIPLSPGRDQESETHIAIAHMTQPETSQT